MSKADEALPVTLRLPPGLRGTLKELARKNNRSMHGEVLRRLTSEVLAKLPEGFNSSTSRGSDQFNVRISQALYDELQGSASRNGRSMNAEAVMRLLGSLIGNGETTPMAAQENSKPHTITVRLTAEQRDRLDRASSLGPYSISLTDIITRGIELAAQELEQMARTMPEGPTK